MPARPLNVRPLGPGDRMEQSYGEAILSETDVEDLQSRLALAELLDRPKRSEDVIELLLFRKEHTKVRLRPERNHPRPHFHVEYKQEHNASYAIDNLERLAGFMPPKYESTVLAWATGRQASLRATWDALLAGQDVRELVLVRQGPNKAAPGDGPYNRIE